jgi:hypothetical protein
MPTIAKGAIIKYNMPWFNPLAGFSPICNAVFVQTEHCAFTLSEKNAVQKKNKNMMRRFFIYFSKLVNKALLQTIV